MDGWIIIIILSQTFHYSVTNNESISHNGKWNFISYMLNATHRPSYFTLCLLFHILISHHFFSRNSIISKMLARRGKIRTLLAHRAFGKLIFDREQLLRNRQFASSYKSSNSARAFFDLPLISMVHKLTATKRDFKNLAFVGPNPASFVRRLDPLVYKEVNKLFVCDQCPASLDKSMEELKHPAKLAKGEKPHTAEFVRRVADEEKWDFAPGQLDGIVSNVQMHWVNNLDEALHRMYDSLAADGMLMLSMLGGTTLHELRLSFTMAEQEREGGVSPIVSPMICLQDLGDALAIAGFRIITTDRIRFAYDFGSMFDLMKFLQLVGESGVGYERRRYKSKNTFIAAAAIYQSLFSSNICKAMMNPIDEKVIPVDLLVENKQSPSNITATFDVLYAIGWKEPRKSLETKRLNPKEAFSMKLLVEELQKIGEVRYGSIDHAGELQEGEL